MNNSIRLLKNSCLQINLHIRFPLILLWGALSFGLFRNGGWEGAIYGVLVTSLVSVIEVLHDLGRAVLPSTVLSRLSRLRCCRLVVVKSWKKSLRSLVLKEKCPHGDLIHRHKFTISA